MPDPDMQARAEGWFARAYDECAGYVDGKVPRIMAGFAAAEVRLFGLAVMRMLDSYREAIKHTRHVDGLGMGNQRAERECDAIKRRVAAMLTGTQSITREGDR